MAKFRSNDLSQFRFKLVSYGVYEVTYTTEMRGDYWKARIEDMSLIDATKNAENARACDIKELYDAVKRKGNHYGSDGILIVHPPLQTITTKEEIIKKIAEHISTKLQDCNVWSSPYIAKVDLYNNNPLHFDTEEPFGWCVEIHFNEQMQYAEGWVITHPENELNVLIDESKRLEEFKLYELKKIYDALVSEYSK